MLQIHSECDVVVVGAGTAGAVAAVQAARAGARTVLIEANGCPGGTMTTGGVAFPGLFHAWGKQIIAGIGWEMLQKTLELCNYPLPDFSRTEAPHWEHQIRIDGPTYACVLEEVFQDAGVEVCYHELPVEGCPLDGGWQLVTIGKGPLRRTVTCREIIDCTGDADVVAMLDYPRERGEECQPGTLYFTFDGYDADTLDADVIQRHYEEALADGRLQPGDLWRSGGRFIDFLNAYGRNAQHVLGADSTNAISKTSANISGRASALRLLRFIRTLPGCQNAYLAAMPLETAVRETYRIIGETTITADDYTTGRTYSDAVCYTFYPIDLHTKDGLDIRNLTPGTVPTIPLSALVPKGSRKLLAAGRCVSSDRLSNSALRVQASCMAMGQAAGAAAALAIQQGVPSRDVDPTVLRALLSSHGAIVPQDI